MSHQIEEFNIKRYKFSTPTFLLNIFIVIILVFAYKNISLQSASYLLFFKIVFPLFVISTIYQALYYEKLIFAGNRIVYKKCILGICFKTISIQIEELESAFYEKVEDGIRLKFRQIYTESIWLVKYYSILINYKKDKSKMSQKIFIGPYDEHLNTIVNSLSNLSK